MDPKIRLRCPGCGAPLLVRVQPLSDSDPMLVTADRLKGAR